MQIKSLVSIRNETLGLNGLIQSLFLNLAVQKMTPQLTITCSKSTIKTLEKGVKNVQS